MLPLSTIGLIKDEDVIDVVLPGLYLGSVGHVVQMILIQKVLVHSNLRKYCKKSSVITKL